MLSDHSGAGGWTSTSAVNDGNDRFRGETGRGRVPSALGLRHCNAAWHRTYCHGLRALLDVKNDEFGLCEVNNAKMDCYPEHASYRAMWSTVRGWPQDWNRWTTGRDDRPPVGEIVRCRGRPSAVVVVLPQIRHRQQKKLITGFTSIFVRHAGRSTFQSKAVRGSP